MRLVFIYGPPGTGKLTVAKELSKLTGYKVFHNHLTIDFVGSLIENETRSFVVLISKYRKELISYAARANVKGVIFTFGYTHRPEDDRFVKELIRLMSRHKVRIHFVKLYCSLEKLRERVRGYDRKMYNKARSVRMLNRILSTYDVFPDIKYVESLKIDNTRLSPGKTARMIMEHYRIRRQAKSRVKGRKMKRTYHAG